MSVHPSRIPAEARAWLSDAFEDCPADLTDDEALAAVRLHYAGGLPAFLRECCDYADA